MDTLKSLVPLWCSMAKELGDVSPRDIETIVSRARKAGDREHTVFTTWLPSLGKQIYRSLETGVLVVPSGFKVHPNNGRPYFLRKLFAEVYSHGCILRTDVTSQWLSKRLRKLLQLTMFAYKLETPLSPAMQEDSWSAFQQSQNVEYTGIPPAVRKHARELIHRVLRCIDPTEIVGRHGNGAVAEKGVSTAHRWYLPYGSFTYDKKIDDTFGWDRLLYVNDNQLVDDYHQFESVPETTGPARLAFVPKDSRGPRTICCEPVTRQFIKLGIMDLLASRIRESKVLAGNIPLNDQSLMQELARAGSITGELATLDLERASDTVLWGHVEDLFPDAWVTALSAVRSPTVTYGEQLVTLVTAFPMGSAVCFPMEALIFWSISKAAMALYGVYQTPSECSSFVFGDDTIVPTSMVEVVTETFARCGFIVNSSKSYWNGKFRESCGGDFFDGNSLSIAKLKKWPGITIATRAECYSSVVSFVNRFNERNDTSCNFTESLYPVFGYVPVFPLLQGDWCIHGEFRAANCLFLRLRYNRDLQREECRFWRVTEKTTEVFPLTCSGWELLYRFFAIGKCSDSKGNAYRTPIPNSSTESWAWFPTFG